MVTKPLAFSRPREGLSLTFSPQPAEGTASEVRWLLFGFPCSWSRLDLQKISTSCVTVFPSFFHIESPLYTNRIVLHTCFKTANGFFMLQGERYTYASAVLKPGSNELNLNYLHAIFPLILELSNRMVTTNFSFLSEQLLCFSQLFWAGFLLELLQFQSFYLPWQKYWVHTELIICFLCSTALTLH